MPNPAALMKSGVHDRYDREGALQFICKATEIDRATATVVLVARDLYRFVVGVDVSPPENDTPGARALRTKYPALFPIEVVQCGVVSPKLEREFIVQESGSDEATVRRILGADRDFRNQVKAPISRSGGT